MAEGQRSTEPSLPAAAVSDFSQSSSLSHPPELHRIGRGELLPDAANDPIFKRKDADGKPLPIYVEVGKGDEDKHSAQIREVDGKAAIIVQEGSHKWNADYVRQHIMESDAALAQHTHPVQEYLGNVKKALESGIYQGPPLDKDTVDTRFAKVAAMVDELAQENQTGTLTIRTGPPFLSSSATETREGSKVVVISSLELVEALASDKKLAQLKLTLGHEVGHIAHGDTSAQGTAASHNTGDHKIREGLADLAVTDQQALARSRMELLKDTVIAYNDKHEAAPLPTQNTTLEHYKTASDWYSKAVDPNHPSRMDRVGMAELYTSLKEGYEKLHSVNTKEERGVEQAWIKGKIIQQLKDGTLPEPASLKAKDAIPDYVKELVQGMQGLPMKDTETHTAPSSSVAPAQKQQQVR